MNNYPIFLKNNIELTKWHDHINIHYLCILKIEWSKNAWNSSETWILSKKKR